MGGPSPRGGGRPALTVLDRLLVAAVVVLCAWSAATSFASDAFRPDRRYHTSVVVAPAAVAGAFPPPGTVLQARFPAPGSVVGTLEVFDASPFRRELVEVRVRDLGGSLWCVGYLTSGAAMAVALPVGDYAVSYASGASWSGPVRLFGPLTSYRGLPDAVVVGPRGGVAVVGSVGQAAGRPIDAGAYRGR